MTGWQGDGLACSHGVDRVQADEDDSDSDSDDNSGADRRDAATQNVTDLRRARQRARAVVRDLQGDVEQFLEENDRRVQRLPDSASERQKLNQQLTRLAQARLAQELIRWLEERRSQTMGRAARESLGRLKQAADAAIDLNDLRTEPYVQTRDQRINRRINQVDVGLYEKLSDDAVDDMVRQLRLGVANDEGTDDLAQRIRYILAEGDADGRQESGVSGQTVMSRAELIAHDSVQQAYNAAASRRYLQNGFRYVVYDATLDLKTTQLCRRLDGVVIDLRENPELLPGNHPWCRSGVRPKLVLDPGEEPIDRSDIADQYLGTIGQTNSFRPNVLDTQAEFNPTTFTPERA